MYSSNLKRDYKFMKWLNKDIVGIISLPSITYNPILKGDYSKRDIKGYESKSGEICIRGVANLEEHTGNGNLPNMCLIEGNRSVNSSMLTKTKFTLMTMYLKSDLKKKNPYLTVYIDGKENKYRYMYAIDRGIENNERVSAKDNKELVEYFKANRNDEKDKVVEKEQWGNLLILKAYDNIDVTMILFEEVGKDEL